MASKPTKVPEGFLTPRQVAEKARKKGFDINPKTIKAYAPMGKIPFAGLSPGKQKLIIFPKTKKKLTQVIAAAPKKAVVPKGIFTADDIYRIAEKKGLSVRQYHIFEKVQRVVRGKEPLPGNFMQDAWGRKHRYLFSKEFVNAFLKDAIRRKNLHEYLERGLLVPIGLLASELGITESTLYVWKKRKKLKTYFIGNKNYATLFEAARFKAWYNEDIAGKITFRGGRPGKRAKKKAAGQETIEPEKLPKPKIDWRTHADAKFWLKNVIPRVGNKAKRKVMRRIILNNTHLSYEEFHKKVILKLDEMLTEKKKGNEAK